MDETNLYKNQQNGFIKGNVLNNNLQVHQQNLESLDQLSSLVVVVLGMGKQSYLLYDEQQQQTQQPQAPQSQNLQTERNTHKSDQDGDKVNNYHEQNDNTQSEQYTNNQHQDQIVTSGGILEKQDSIVRDINETNQVIDGQILDRSDSYDEDDYMGGGIPTLDCQRVYQMFEDQLKTLNNKNNQQKHNTKISFQDNTQIQRNYHNSDSNSQCKQQNDEHIQSGQNQNTAAQQISYDCYDLRNMLNDQSSKQEHVVDYNTKIHEQQQQQQEGENAQQYQQQFAQGIYADENQLEHRLLNSDADIGLLLLLPLTLGIRNKVDQRYLHQLKIILEMPQSIGILGGHNKAQSVYLAGYQKDNLFYLDPHTLQEKVLNLHDQQNYQTYNIRHIRSMPLEKLDPSLAIGFVCSTLSESQDLFRRLNNLQNEYKGAPIVVVKNMDSQSTEQIQNSPVGRGLVDDIVSISDDEQDSNQGQGSKHRVQFSQPQYRSLFGEAYSSNLSNNKSTSSNKLNSQGYNQMQTQRSLDGQISRQINELQIMSNDGNTQSSQGEIKARSHSAGQNQVSNSFAEDLGQEQDYQTPQQIINFNTSSSQNQDSKNENQKLFDSNQQYQQQASQSDYSHILGNSQNGNSLSQHTFSQNGHSYQSQSGSGHTTGDLRNQNSFQTQSNQQDKSSLEQISSNSGSKSSEQRNINDRVYESQRASYKNESKFGYMHMNLGEFNGYDQYSQYQLMSQDDNDYAVQNQKVFGSACNLQSEASRHQAKLSQSQQPISNRFNNFQGHKSAPQYNEMIDNEKENSGHSSFNVYDTSVPNYFGNPVSQTVQNQDSQEKLKSALKLQSENSCDNTHEVTKIESNIGRIKPNRKSKPITSSTSEQMQSKMGTYSEDSNSHMEYQATRYIAGGPWEYSSNQVQNQDYQISNHNNFQQETLQRSYSAHNQQYQFPQQSLQGNDNDLPELITERSFQTVPLQNFQRQQSQSFTQQRQHKVRDAQKEQQQFSMQSGILQQPNQQQPQVKAPFQNSQQKQFDSTSGTVQCNSSKEQQLIPDFQYTGQAKDKTLLQPNFITLNQSFEQEQLPTQKQVKQNTILNDKRRSKLPQQFRQKVQEPQIQQNQDEHQGKFQQNINNDIAMPGSIQRTKSSRTKQYYEYAKNIGEPLNSDFNTTLENNQQLQSPLANDQQTFKQQLEDIIPNPLQDYNNFQRHPQINNKSQSNNLLYSTLNDKYESRPNCQFQPYQLQSIQFPRKHQGVEKFESDFNFSDLGLTAQRQVSQEIESALFNYYPHEQIFECSYENNSQNNSQNNNQSDYNGIQQIEEDQITQQQLTQQYPDSQKHNQLLRQLSHQYSGKIMDSLDDFNLVRSLSDKFSLKTNSFRQDQIDSKSSIKSLRQSQDSSLKKSLETAKLMDNTISSTAKLTSSKNIKYGFQTSDSVTKSPTQVGKKLAKRSKQKQQQPQGNLQNVDSNYSNTIQQTNQPSIDLDIRDMKSEATKPANLTDKLHKSCNLTNDNRNEYNPAAQMSIQQLYSDNNLQQSQLQSSDDLSYRENYSQRKQYSLLDDDHMLMNLNSQSSIQKKDINLNHQISNDSQSPLVYQSCNNDSSSNVSDSYSRQSSRHSLNLEKQTSMGSQKSKSNYHLYQLQQSLQQQQQQQSLTPRWQKQYTQSSNQCSNTKALPTEFQSSEYQKPSENYKSIEVDQGDSKAASQSLTQSFIDINQSFDYNERSQNLIDPQSIPVPQQQSNQKINQALNTDQSYKMEPGFSTSWTQIESSPIVKLQQKPRRSQDINSYTRRNIAPEEGSGSYKLSSQQPNNQQQQQNQNRLKGYQQYFNQMKSTSTCFDEIEWTYIDKTNDCDFDQQRDSWNSIDK